MLCTLVGAAVVLEVIGVDVQEMPARVHVGVRHARLGPGNDFAFRCYMVTLERNWDAWRVVETRLRLVG